MRAARLLASNISALLTARGNKQKELALWCRHSEVWISKFLRGDREMQLKDLDRVADFFGIATYQLFQPGIGSLTERRAGIDRRNGRDRRVGHTQRVMLETGAHIDAKRGRKDADVATPLGDQLRRLTAEHERRISALLSQAESGGQITAARRVIAAPRARRRDASGRDAEEV